MLGILGATAEWLTSKPRVRVISFEQLTRGHAAMGW